MPLLWGTYIVLWVLVAILIVMVVLLYRQFGIMLMPGSQRMNMGGLDVGDPAPILPVEFQGERDSSLVWEGEMSSQKGWLVMFALAGCSVCERLWSDQNAARLPRAWGDVRFIWIDQLPHEEGATPAGWRFATSRELAAHRAMDVPASPFAYVINGDGKVGAKALVNTSTDIDQLLRQAFPGRGAPLSLPTIQEAGEAIVGRGRGTNGSHN